MHVLALSDVYFPRINGVSTSIRTFREALPGHGVHMTVVAPEYGADAQEDALIRLPARRVPLDPEDRLMGRSGLRELPRRLAELDRGIDLVHVQTPFAAHYAGVDLARRLGVPCVTTYHTHFEEYLFHYVPFAPRRTLRGLARRVARQQCNAVDAVVVPSPAMADTLRGYGVSAPVHAIPTGLPDRQFVRGDGTAFRRAYSIGAEHKLALFVGRAAHEKNIGFLIDMLAIARRQRPDLLLVVAGEGPALPALRRQAARLGVRDSVRFVGYLPRDTGLADCYAAADVFVFASLTETQGLVLLEAMAAGLPVLAIPALGAASIVAPGRGAVAASDEPAGFAGQLTALLDNPARLAEMGRTGVDFAREWDAGAQAGRLAGLYRELIATGPRSAA